MKTLIFLLSLFSVSLCSAQKKIPYQLPYKSFEVTVTYTVKDVKVFKKESDKILKSTGLLRHYTTVSIQDPIKVEGKMWLSGDLYFLDFGANGKGGRSFNVDFGFDSDGAGMLTSLNAEQQPITSDLISGTVSIVGGVIGIVAKNIIPFNAFTGSNTEGEIVETTEQKIEIHRLITDFAAAQTITLDQSTANQPYPFVSGGNVKFSNLITAIPTVTISFSKLGKVATGVTGNSTSADQIFFRIPSAYQLLVKVQNNLFAKEQAVIDQIVHIPQEGSLQAVPVDLFGGKKTLQIAFSPVTGNLIKYSIKKESSVRATLAQTKTSIDELSTAVRELQDKLNEDNSVQEEINRLQLDIQRLELIKQQKQLLEPDPDTQ